MKKFKSLACLILAVLTLMTAFAINASAATLPSSATLHITKYEVTDSTGIDVNTIIGNTNTLTGTTADAPTGKETLDGVTFAIYKAGGLDTDAAKVDTTSLTKVTEVTTANGGVATFTVNSADFGLYYVVETSAPAQVTTKSVPFFVYLPMTDPAGTGFMADVYAYPKNYIPLGGAKLQKLDGDKALAGVEFKLYKKDGTQVKANYLGETFDTFTTNAQGYIEVSNLPVGEYYFLETKALDGYMLKTDKYEFTVSADKLGIQTLEPVQNSTEPQIEKYVTEVGNSSDITGFNKYNNATQKWIIISGVPSDMDADVYTEYKITDDMDAVLNLMKNTVVVYKYANNTYTALDNTDYTVGDPDADNIFEIKVTDLTAIEGAEKIKVEYNTTLSESALTYTNYYNDANLTIDAENFSEPYTAKIPVPPYVYTGEINFKKTNASNAGLAGAKFDLYVKGSADPVVTDITSGTDGTFVIKGLPFGKYELEETKAPDKYELLSKRVEFEVNESSYTTKKDDVTVIVNQATPDLPITGGMGTVIFTVAGLGLITLSAVFFVASKKSKKED